MEKRTIKIAGAGLAGLTSAINLAKAGFKVEVYEKSSQVGEHYKENPQMLPNWFSKEDVIEELEKCNVKINWTQKIERVEVYLPNGKVMFYGNKIPVGYTVLRGGENSFEKELAKQAKSLGVNILTNSSWNIEKPGANKPDIIATGFSKVITLGYGQVYNGEFEPNKVKVFFNPSYTPSIGYGYFFPHNRNLATIKISSKVSEERIDVKKNLKKIREKYLNQEIKKENFLYEFGTKRSFNIPKSAIQNQSLLVGEAAGFQDELFRFGIRYAVVSGYLAARSIIEGLNYDELWKQRFMKEFQRTKKTRRIFEDFKRKGFNNLPEKMEFTMEIEKFKKLWLSKRFNLLLSLYPLYRNLILHFPIPMVVFKKI